MPADAVGAVNAARTFMVRLNRSFHYAVVPAGWCAAGGAALQFFLRHVFDVRRNPPLIAVGVDDRAVAIAIELRRRLVQCLRSSADRLLVQGVDVGHIEIEHRRERRVGAAGLPDHDVESPTCISACPMDPSGRRMTNRSCPLNPRVMKSMSAAASLATRYGVTVWKPSGIGLTAINSLLSSNPRS
jgi:hypothetical protein